MTTAAQTSFVACIPIRCDPAWAGLQVRAVEDQLQALGNPAVWEVRGALTKTGCIHFMSMSVMWNGKPAEQPILLIDVSGDGDVKTIIDKLAEHASHYLQPVLQRARGVIDAAGVRACLRKYARKAFPTPYPGFGAATGLAFKGTPKLTVARIRKDASIAELSVREVIELHREGGAQQSPLDVLREVRRRLTRRHSAKLFDGTDKDAPPDPSHRFRRLISTTIMQSGAMSTLTWLVVVLAGLIAWYWLVRDGVPWPQTLLQTAAHAGLVFIYLWVGAILALLLAASAVATVSGVLAARLRTLEGRDKPRDAGPDVMVVKEIMLRENRRGPRGRPMAQNHMVAISTLKPGFLRRKIALVVALHIIEMLIKTRLFKEGLLSNVGTIHFAQWIRIPKTDKLVFLSNYDGSWESYLEDFITKAHNGLNAIWSNTEGYPATEWLALKGAADGDSFKRWARREQVPTLFWYSAYPYLSTAQIRTNVRIREGLEHLGSLSDAEDWLKSFGSAPRPFYALETHEVQSLVLSPHRHLRNGACLLISFEGRAAAAQAWIEEISGNSNPSVRVSFGDDRHEQSATALGLTARGLERLGLANICRPTPKKPAKAINFSPAFVIGMDDPTRSEALGDVNGSAPTAWEWGGPRKPVCAVLLIYAASKKELEQLRQTQLALIATHRLEVVTEVEMEELPKCGDPVLEPFGFADGISQPAIRGAARALHAAEQDLVEPGEFILGYKDGRQCYPPSPRVHWSDGRDVLPTVALVDAEQRTGYDDGESDFTQTLDAITGNSVDLAGANAAPKTRDLGRNGTYLVIRQLEQDVEKFNSYTEMAATALQQTRSSHGFGYRDAAWVAAKMMGRWQNGASLVRHPERPPANYDPKSNEDSFMFGRDDPQGLGCPFGAHIRRANPRDSFDPLDPDQIPIVKRHRLLRRGRAYREGEQRGLLFMCVNADIERQFEFVQQNWIASNNIQGLREEVDPVAAASNDGQGTFTIPLATGPERLDGLPSFVTVRGGAYFFMPSRRALQYLALLKKKRATPTAGTLDAAVGLRERAAPGLD